MSGEVKKATGAGALQATTSRNVYQYQIVGSEPLLQTSRKLLSLWARRCCVPLRTTRTPGNWVNARPQKKHAPRGAKPNGPRPAAKSRPSCAATNAHRAHRRQKRGAPYHSSRKGAAASNTHTHTHTLSLSLSLCFSFSLFLLSLSLSLSLCFSFSLFLLSLSLSLSHTLAIARPVIPGKPSSSREQHTMPQSSPLLRQSRHYCRPLAFQIQAEPTSACRART